MNDIIRYKNYFKEIESIPVIPIKESTVLEEMFTFCVPTYLRASRLDQTLQSIYNQKTDIKYNVIISDNNSTRGDETENLIDERYSSKQNLSYYKNSQNIRAYGNWNRLVLLCKTKYLILIHDDDILCDNYLEEVVKILKQYPNASGINVDKCKWFGEDVLTRPDQHEKCRVVYNTSYTNFAFFTFGAQTGCLLRVCDIMETGGFSSDITYSFDYFNVFQMCCMGKLMLNYEKKLILYRCMDNTSNNMDVQLSQIEEDILIRMQVAEYLSIPHWYLHFVIWLKTKIRLRSINKINKVLSYKGYTPGGFAFMLIYKFFEFVYLKIWFNRMHCLMKI